MQVDASRSIQIEMTRLLSPLAARPITATAIDSMAEFSFSEAITLRRS